MPAAAFEYLPGSIPCREHPCCVSHGHDVPPTLPVASATQRPGASQASVEKTDPAFGTQRHLVYATFGSAFQLYSSFNTVLRI
ncbi:MAG: hypothetical protein WB510_05530 [Candidatus Sulfotelmatobacter sp.]